MNMPGFAAPASLYRTSATYYGSLTAATTTQGRITAQFDWCGLKCEAQYAGCVYGCTHTGPGAVICAAACVWKTAKCFGDCDSSPPPCINPTSCTSMFECCQDHFCIDRQCIPCGRSRQTRCSGPGGTPCCTGYHCCGIGCYPDSMQCP
jgi:hypothetical protein